MTFGCEHNQGEIIRGHIAEITAGLARGRSREGAPWNFGATSYPPNAAKDDPGNLERGCWRPSEIGDDPHGEHVVD